MLTSQLLLSSIRVFHLILPVSTSIFSLRGLWTITASLPLQFSAYHFISFHFQLVYYTYPKYQIELSPTQTVLLFFFFLYSLDLSYLQPQFLFNKWGYDNPIYSSISQLFLNIPIFTKIIPILHRYGPTIQPVFGWLSHVTTWFCIPDFKLLC